MTVICRNEVAATRLHVFVMRKLEVVMCNIVVGRYSNPETQKMWQGWIEPEDKAWIVFITADGSVSTFLNRDLDTGAVK